MLPVHSHLPVVKGSSAIQIQSHCPKSLKDIHLMKVVQEEQRGNQGNHDN